MKRNLKIYFYHNPDPQKEKYEAKLARKAAEHKFAHYRTDTLGDASIMIAFGGDGTALDAMKELVHYQATQKDRAFNIPSFFGLNYGSVGYLMNRHVSDVPQMIQKTTCVTFHPLETTIDDEKGKRYHRFACNEVVAHRDSRNGQSCHLNLEIIDRSHWDLPQTALIQGDGVVISTGVGSTAYFYDAGGEPFAINSSSIGVQPICDRESSKKIAGVYADRKEFRINVLNTNKKRPVYVNTDNDERIDNVTRCIVRANKKIVIPMLMGQYCPALQNRVRA